MNFCEKCCCLVPENEIFTTKEFEFRGKKVPQRKIHKYKETYNVNGYSPGRFNYCAAVRDVFCGDIREPSKEEYFIYVTLGSDV